MRTCVIVLTAVFLALPLSAGEWQGSGPADRRVVQPVVAEHRSNGTAIIDFAAGSPGAVVGRTESLLEARFAPGADRIAQMPHAIFVLADGSTVMKAIMYRWTTPVDLQIAVPYSDRWQVRAVYVGGMMDYAKANALPPMLLSGRDFSAGIAAAPLFAVNDERRMESNQASDCFRTANGCLVCFDCWWNFCGDPYSVC